MGLFLRTPDVPVPFAAQAATTAAPAQATGAPSQQSQIQAVVPTQAIAALPAGSFQESFDGQPSSPTPWNSPRWDITVHSRDRDTWHQLETMQAMHGADCAGAPATHTVSSYEDAVFQCRDHVMTAIEASGYGLIYLTPNQIVDFSQDEAVIRWDMSTLRTSTRDWIDLWVTPFDDNLQLAFDDGAVDLSGPPRNAVHIQMDLSRNSFFAVIYNNFQGVEVEAIDDWTAYDTFLQPDAKRRDTFELRLSRSHLRFGMPEYNFYWIDNDIPQLNWAQGVVQFGHHSYNPLKDCLVPCSANTWHWDNVEISPAHPFNLIKAAQRYVDPSTGESVSFEQPAPQGAHLRFAGIGNALEVSFDDGKTWQAAQLQAQDESYFKDEHFKSFWTPIPAGVQQIQLRGQNWWGGDWHIRDISIWAP